jgi:hypothetical protein
LNVIDVAAQNFHVAAVYFKILKMVSSPDEAVGIAKNLQFAASQF